MADDLIHMTPGQILDRAINVAKNSGYFVKDFYLNSEGLEIHLANSDKPRWRTCKTTQHRLLRFDYYMLKQDNVGELIDSYVNCAIASNPY